MAPGRRILFLVGDYAEDYEVMVPFQTLQALGFSTDAVCPGKKEGDICRTAVHDFEGDQEYLLKSVLCPWLGAFHKQTYSEKPGHNFVLNATFSEVSWDEYDALVIPGGRAPEYLSVDESVIKLVQGFNAALKPIAAICHGPLILAAAGVLKGKKCTAYPACKPALVAAGAIWEEPDPISACFMDECLVTGAGWLGHPEFIGLLLMAMGARVQGSDKRVLLLAGDYVEDYEVMVPYQAMQSLDYRVDTVCPGKRKDDFCMTAIHDFEGAQTYSEKPGHRFQLNSNFDDVKVEDYDVLLIPGGRAPEYLSINDKVLDLVRQFDKEKKVIATICHGPLILSAAGVLQGKRLTAYPAVKPAIFLAGAEWLEPEPITKCFKDGNLITGAAWPAHPEFLALIMDALGTTVST
eukprot:SM000042S15356  [mRNA]  locus=s42:566664:568961:- [translate_table: standard]